MGQRDRTAPPAAFRAVGGEEAQTYRVRARRLGLPFVSVVHLGSDALTNRYAVENGRVAWSATRDLYIAPDEEAMAGAIACLNAYSKARPRILVSTPTAIRAALREAGAQSFLADAIARVEVVDRAHSARRTITKAQAVAGAIVLMAFAASAALNPLGALTLTELVVAVFFVFVAAIRFIAAARVPERLPAPRRPPAGQALPVYTILVPLRHEGHMLQQLMSGLDRLQWPRERLDIKLVIDADDIVTLGAARMLARQPPYEIVVVPPGGPQTKPTALQYALSFARGEFVTVYDAEDRPHPEQLAEAYATFRSAPGRLACLQAPLIIDNPDKSLLAGLFAVEYSMLFDGLLPALARLRLPLPLGGTSNHFRRSALERVGGWDPWNVTEDADLGIRLSRFGYATSTITLPTLEEAPVTLRPWMRQRTRWFKGWMQTWLVHMRHPLALWRALGTRQMIGFNALGLGMIVSAVAHPVFLAAPVLIALDPSRLWNDGDLFVAAIAGLSIFNLAAGYAAMWTLAAKTLPLRGRRGLMPLIYLLPFYWLLMGAACLLAFREIAFRPHQWNKTPHVGRPLRNRAMAGIAAPVAPQPRRPAAEETRVRRA